MAEVEGDGRLYEDVASEEQAIARAFGAENRRRIIADYFDESGLVNVGNAWEHVYRLLLWINPTIGLAHCYESDKCQPHKAWYPRSLAFHAWVSDHLRVPPSQLREHIDRLFRGALPGLAYVETEVRRAAATKHLDAYPVGSMPEPGDDPDLIDIIGDVLGASSLNEELDETTARLLVERVYAHFAQENKRKNLLGRGFEDTLAAIVDRLPGGDHWTVGTRVHLADIPGFNPRGESEKAAEVDLALWKSGGGSTRRVLVSSKWSVRADRERQFESDFDDYVKANTGGLFDYVLVTNEFDAARLDRACANVRGNQYLLSKVVHVAPDAVLAAYGTKLRASAAKLPGHMDAGRLVSLEQWLSDLTA